MSARSSSVEVITIEQRYAEQGRLGKLSVLFFVSSGREIGGYEESRGYDRGYEMNRVLSKICNFKYLYEYAQVRAGVAFRLSACKKRGRVEAASFLP